MQTTIIILLSVIIAKTIYIIYLLHRKSNFIFTSNRFHTIYDSDKNLDEKKGYYKLPNMFDKIREKAQLIAKDINEAIKNNSHNLYISDENGNSINLKIPNQMTIIFSDDSGKPTLGCIIGSEELRKAISAHLKSKTDHN